MEMKQVDDRDGNNGVIQGGNSMPGDQDSDGGGGGRFAPPPLDSIMGEQVKSGMLPEVDAAAAWGVTRGVLREIRDTELVEFEDWRRENRVIYLLENGVKKISKKLGMEFDVMWVNVVGVSKVPHRESVTIVSTARNGQPHFTNFRLVKCARSNGEEILVVVRRSHNYRPRLTNGAPMTMEDQKEGNK